MIPLVTRTAASLAHWLSPAFDSALRLEPDLDGVDALAPEREALWARIGAAGFLTDDEKREAVGYGAKPGAKALDPAAEGVGGGVGDLIGSPIGGGGGAPWENQPRVPPGNPDGGQWTSGSGGGLGSTQVAANFEKDQLKLTVQQFISSQCRGGINSVMPGQFYDMTIGDVLARAQAGDKAARTCKKLLERPEYRK